MRESVKQRLIAALAREVEEETSDREIMARLSLLRELGNRGSGPLPAHLRREAEQRGIT